MRERPARGPGPRRGLLAAVAELFVEPVDVVGAPEPATADSRSARPVVAVVGFGRRCGTTTVARALAVELAARDAVGAAVVSATALPGGAVPLGSPAAARLGRAVQRVLATRTRLAGRLCLALVEPGGEAELVGALRGMAPVVLDVEEPAGAAVAASLADSVVLVGGPATEPALAPVLAASLARVGPPPLVVLNRAAAGDADAVAAWDRHAAICLPEARLGAQIALAGREARGGFGHAVGALADRVGAGAP